MKRRFVTILLLSVFAITILPLRQVGRMLYNNQWTEELSEHAETKGKQTGPSFSLHPFDFLLSEVDGGQLFKGGLTYLLNYRQALPAIPVGEILVPPPNCA
jgi:hypothetical protein